METLEQSALSDCESLVAAARAACSQAFLTKEGGVRYGAAVLTRSGRVFTSGQYSSFNHVTNVHAEQAALVLATMAGEPDIVALAVASTASDSVTRPCGVCRQVMLEHATRSGRDFRVLMSRRDGGYEELAVSALLPHSWTAHSQRTAGADSAGEDQRSGSVQRTATRADGSILTGDLVELQDGTLGMVWDTQPVAGMLLVKLKYATTAPSRYRKLAHSFSEPLRYEQQLHELGWARPAPWGGVVALVSQVEMARVFPALPAEDHHGEIAEPLRRFLEDVGVPWSCIAISGSRALGLEHPSSDYDLVLRLSPDEARALSARIGAAMAAGACAPPQDSGTWRIVAKSFPGGQAAILAADRFVWTLALAGQSVAFLLDRFEPPAAVFAQGFWAAGRQTLTGRVVDTRGAHFKRAVASVETASGETVELIAWHKLANLLRDGDEVAVRGWVITDGAQRRLIQLCPLRDNIVWLRPLK